MMPPLRRTLTRATARDSGARRLAPQTQAKIVAQLHADGVEYDLAEGACIIADLGWEAMRDLVIPVRRILTHREAEDVSVLYRPDGARRHQRDALREPHAEHDRRSDLESLAHFADD